MWLEPLHQKCLQVPMSAGIAVIMDPAAVNVAVDVVAAAAVAAIAAVAARAAALRIRTEYNFTLRVTLSHRDFAAEVHFAVDALVRRLQLLRDVKHRQLSLIVLILLSWCGRAAEKIPPKTVTCELLLQSLENLASTNDVEISLEHIRSRVEYRVGSNVEVSLEPVFYDGFTSEMKKESQSGVLKRLNALALSLEKKPDIRIVALEFRGKDNIEKALHAALTLEPEMNKSQYRFLIQYLQQLIQELPNDRFLIIGSSPQEQSTFLDQLAFFDGNTMEPVWIAIYRAN
jgi:hypothetical protein